MNPKDESINLVVNKLLKKFKPTQIKINDYWEGDLCAIGFSDINEIYMVYISTYDRETNKYYVSLDNLLAGNDNLYETIEVFENISYSKLENIIFSHLINR